MMYCTLLEHISRAPPGFLKKVMGVRRLKANAQAKGLCWGESTRGGSTPLIRRGLGAPPPKKFEK